MARRKAATTGGREYPVGVEEHKGKLRIYYSEFRKTLSHLSAFNRKHVEAAAQEIDGVRRRLQDGRSPYAEADEGTFTAFSAACTKFLKLSQAKTKDCTFRGYKKILENNWIPVFGNWPVQDIQSRHIEEALADMVNTRSEDEEPISVKTRKNRLVPLSCVLSTFKVNPNPCAAVEHPRVQKPEIERYTLKERDLLCNGLTGMSQVYHVLMFACGFRPGEALGLKVKDLNRENYIFHVQRQITDNREEKTLKNYSRRFVILPLWARPLLDFHLHGMDKDEYILQTQNGRPIYDRHELYDTWHEVHERLDIPYRVAYTCRHTRAAELLSMGVSYGEAAEQLGHSPECFLRIYADFMREYSMNRDFSHLEGGKGVNLILPVQQDGNVITFPVKR